MTALRISIGATDFSDNRAISSCLPLPRRENDASVSPVYTFDDKSGDTSLGSFTSNNAPSYLWSTLDDIASVNSILRIFILPWSAVGCLPVKKSHFLLSDYN